MDCTIHATYLSISDLTTQKIRPSIEYYNWYLLIHKGLGLTPSFLAQAMTVFVVPWDVVAPTALLASVAWVAYKYISFHRTIESGLKYPTPEKPRFPLGNLPMLK